MTQMAPRTFECWMMANALEAKAALSKVPMRDLILCAVEDDLSSGSNVSDKVLASQYTVELV